MNNEEKILSLLVEMKTSQDQMNERIGSLEAEVKNIFEHLVKQNEEIRQIKNEVMAINKNMEASQKLLLEHEWIMRKEGLR